MQLDQVTSGLGFAGFVVFSSYVYTVVSKERYQQTTSLVRGSYLAGSVLASLLGTICQVFVINLFAGQLIYSYFEVPLDILFYISCGAYGVCVLLVLFFPHTVERQTVSSLYSMMADSNAPCSHVDNLLALPAKVFHSYSQGTILQLSLWSQVWLMVHHIVLLFWQVPYPCLLLLTSRRCSPRCPGPPGTASSPLWRTHWRRC
jgi:hypothetical protein